MFEELYRLVPGLRDVVVSVHCHDDLGLAVANSLAGVQAGAGRWSARSTGSASAPATPRWRRS
jgi:isopropylmalate/homocitrate/citramalate synthase